MHQVVTAHSYLFWVKCHPNRIFPPKKLEWEPQNRPHFLPIVKPHPLNALTHGPPPMYLLGTSRWCLSPLCMLPFHLNLFLFGLHTIFAAFAFCSILLYMLVDVYLLWHEGHVGFWAHIFFFSSLLKLGITWKRAFIFLLSLCFPSLWPWALWPLILQCHFIVPATFLPIFFISKYPVGLWVDVPVMSAHSPINLLLRASLAHFPHFYLFWACWPTFLPCQPILPLHSFGFLGPYTSSLPLLLPWAFY